MIKRPRPTKPDPTPEQIRERCLEIQQGWSETVRNSRRLATYGLELRDVSHVKPSGERIFHLWAPPTLHVPASAIPAPEGE